VNPYGPVLSRTDGSSTFVSDGEVVWQIDMEDVTSVPVPIGPGSFPALSPDGISLAASIPVGVDSVSTFVTVPAGLGSCTQETVEISAAGWQTVIYDLASGTSVPLAAGLEPVYDPAGGRLLVRRAGGFYWIDLAAGTETLVSGTFGGYAPSVSPDGEWIAFSSENVGGGHDVYLVRSD